MNKLTPEDKDFIRKTEEEDSLIKAFSFYVTRGNYNPTLKQLKDMTKLPVETIFHIKQNWQFNPKTSASRLLVPSAINTLVGIMNDPESSDRDKIAASKEIIDIHRDKEIGANTGEISLTMTLTSSKDIEEVVDIKHNEVENAEV